MSKRAPFRHYKPWFRLVSLSPYLHSFFARLRRYHVL